MPILTGRIISNPELKHKEMYTRGPHDGKRVVITGGTSGIGLATAKFLLDRGSCVLVTGRTKATLDKAREEPGSSAILVESDTASLADIPKLADRVRSEFGGLDALLVCAGQTRFAPFENVTESIFDELLAVNTKGPRISRYRSWPR